MKSLKKIGILTSVDMKKLLDYDQKLSNKLNANGIITETIEWEKANENNLKADMLLFRTTWGYHREIEKFKRFLDLIDKKGIPSYNPTSIIRGNLHKFYLKHLEDKGIKIIPTIFIEQNSRINLEEFISEKGWEKFIIKPAVSAGSYNTVVGSLKSVQDDSLFFEKSKTNDLLLQKYMPEIRSTGEFSTIFLGDYHYTVLKTPQNGDYRVQRDFGGVYTKTTPPTEVLRASKEIADIYKSRSLYIRVDGVFAGGEFYLMEVEMIEPDLYMNIVPKAIDIYYELIMERIKNL